MPVSECLHSSRIAGKQRADKKGESRSAWPFELGGRRTQGRIGAPYAPANWLTIEAGGTISGEDLLAGLLERIGERFDIDFGPGDGSGCGTAETDAFIPDAIGNVDLGPACTTHDAAYSNLELTKAESDLAFFSDVFDAAQAGGATTVESFVLSSVYYASVFYFGGPAWLAAQQEAMQNA